MSGQSAVDKQHRASREIVLTSAESDNRGVCLSL